MEPKLIILNFQFVLKSMNSVYNERKRTRHVFVVLYQILQISHIQISLVTKNNLYLFLSHMYHFYFHDLNLPEQKTKNCT